ncbi:MAG: aspartate aminotransferase family protein [Phaeodactylibacter sp.]|nr:aspartate aminotransferase family protein [Phaeodactylibacter sp.]MCB9286992.1 aspartate aminotransferase family protein [Lewinellaceae bacterium]
MIPNHYVQQGDANHTATRRSYLNEQDPETRQWIEEDARYFLHQALSTPVMNVLSKAEGAYIYDMQGKKYLDLHGNGVHNIGFSNPVVTEAVKQQLENQLAFTPRRYTNRPAVQFAKKLTEMAPPGLSRVLFCPGGSEAVEMAVLLAKQVTGKWKTISFWDNYHGTTYQAATIGGTEHFMVGQGPMVPGAFHVEFPNYYRNPWGLKDKEAIDEQYLRQIEVIVERHPDIACIMGTTITSTPVVPTAYYWQRVKDICERHGALLIFDEIVCGLGRSGKLFACEHYLTPDVVVLGKSLGGGLLPFAGILTHEKYNTLQHRSIGHFTHEKSPLCSAAGLATLEYIENHEVVANAAQLGNYLKERLLELQEEFPIIGNVEGQGLHLALDLITGPVTKGRAFEEAEKILYECMKRGLSFKLIDGNVITLRPALIITRDEVDFIADTLRAAFQTLN